MARTYCSYHMQPVGKFETAAGCADKCASRKSFLYGRRGTYACDSAGCKCVCVTSNDGWCNPGISTGYDFYLTSGEQHNFEILRNACRYYVMSRDTYCYYMIGQTIAIILLFVFCFKMILLVMYSLTNINCVFHAISIILFRMAQQREINITAPVFAPENKFTDQMGVNRGN